MSPLVSIGQNRNCQPSLPPKQKLLARSGANYLSPSKFNLSDIENIFRENLPSPRSKLFPSSAGNTLMICRVEARVVSDPPSGTSCISHGQFYSLPHRPFPPRPPMLFSVHVCWTVAPGFSCGYPTFPRYMCAWYPCVRGDMFGYRDSYAGNKYYIADFQYELLTGAGFIVERKGVASVAEVRDLGVATTGHTGRCARSATISKVVRWHRIGLPECAFSHAQTDRSEVLKLKLEKMQRVQRVHGRVFTCWHRLQEASLEMCTKSRSGGNAHSL